MKSTFRASSDIALIKYWGKKNAALRLPENGSVSFILDALNTTTTIEFSEFLQEDHVLIQGATLPHEIIRIRDHLDRIRNISGIPAFARVESTNTFPKGTGLSSSGSGFAALTYAALAALGMQLTEKETSILARLASGTACRCVCGGFVEWKDGTTSDTSYSETIFQADHWDIRDIVVVIDRDMKKKSSTEGHKTAHSSLFFPLRKANIRRKIETIKNAIKLKDFTALGEISESEALEFHSILHTSNPPLITWYPGTIQVIQEVQKMRDIGIEAYFTINTGFNVHVLTEPRNIHEVKGRLEELSMVNGLIEARVGSKPVELTSHLF